MARKAFIMGFNGPEEVGSLLYAKKDAETIAQVLSNPRCSFQINRPKNIKTASSLRQQLFNSAGACNPEDTFLCYFSGHGILEQGELYLVLDKTNPNQIWSTALSVNDVLKALKNCKASNKLLILDCCHAGGAVGFKEAGAVPVNELKIEAANHFILMASNRLERARELKDLKGSFLTNKISEALTNKFYEADKDNDLKISIEDLLAWLEECTAKHNSSSAFKVPQPYLFGQKKGNFYLTLDSTTWKPFEIPLPNESTVVILPIAPFFAPSENGKIIEVAVGISKYLVTNSQYKTFLENNPSSKEPVGENFNRQTRRWVGPFYPWKDSLFNSPDKPVVCVSYEDSIAYCKWIQKLFIEQIQKEQQSILAKILKLNSKKDVDIIIGIPPHRLWDFAAFGTEYPIRKPNVWLSQTQKICHKQESPSPIDTFNSRTNKLGVSDMIGNVWEWCGEYTWSFHGCYLRDYSQDIASLGEIAEEFTDSPPVLAYFDDFGYRDKIRRDGFRARLKGGGFLDDLSAIEPFIKATELANKEKTKHSDLGFRIALQIPLNLLPENIQLQLRMFGTIDSESYLDTLPDIVEDLTEPDLVDIMEELDSEKAEELFKLMEEPNLDVSDEKPTQK